MRRDDWLFFFGYAGISVIAYMLPWLIGLTHPNPLSITVGVLWCAGWPVLLMKLRLHQRNRQ